MPIILDFFFNDLKMQPKMRAPNTEETRSAICREQNPSRKQGPILAILEKCRSHVRLERERGGRESGQFQFLTWSLNDPQRIGGHEQLKKNKKLYGNLECLEKGIKLIVVVTCSEEQDKNPTGLRLRITQAIVFFTQKRNRKKKWKGERKFRIFHKSVKGFRKFETWLVMWSLTVWGLFISEPTFQHTRKRRKSSRKRVDNFFQP